MSEPTRLSAGPRGANEHAPGSQGRHKDNQKIKNKCEGDGFMADLHYYNGFACSFRLRSMLPPTKNVRLKSSALHSRFLGLFDASPESD